MSNPTNDLSTLDKYDYICVNSSGGKDSQAMLDYVVEIARELGLADRLLVVHADLGHVEWPGTRELVEEHAAHYGLRFEVVSREQGLLDHVRQYRKWPGGAIGRYCTSDHKTSQTAKLKTRLAREAREAGLVDRPARILTCLGIRAEESAGRARQIPFAQEKAETGKGMRKICDRWFPIFKWSEAEVWARILEAGTRSHWAYQEGMSRLSCRFCVYASRGDLITSARLNPELLEEYCEIEAEIGHRFRNDLSMADVRRMAAEDEAQGTLFPV